MTIHRFHVPNVAHGIAELPEAAFGHVTRVLRLGVGDAIRVFDSGREFEATVATIEKRRAMVDVGSAITPLAERAVRLHLIMSPLKGDLTELVIQKATELGVARISPVIFERTDTVARRDPSDNRMERWRRVIVSATEQSGRALVPTLDAVVTLKQAMDALGPPHEAERRILATEPAIEAPNAIPAKTIGVHAVFIAVGPAGGLADSDLATLDAAHFTRERFAPHVLRSETACMAALAILGARYS